MTESNGRPRDEDGRKDHRRPEEKNPGVTQHLTAVNVMLSIIGSFFATAEISSSIPYTTLGIDGSIKSTVALTVWISLYVLSAVIILKIGSIFYYDSNSEEHTAPTRGGE